LEAHHRVQHFSLKWGVYFTGLLIMALGIVLTIKAEFGTSPWDVLHIGLFKQFGLTIGTWSIIVGFFILIVSSLISKKRPQLGAFLNMLTVGVFIDMYMLLPFLQTPEHIISKIIMLLVGILINGYGMGLYISARCGAGPRDSLMIVLTDLTGWKVQNIRTCMEVLVLLVGWLMGGPVFIGTIIYCIAIGYVAGFALPQCRRLTDSLANRIGRAGYEHVEVNHFSN
jgi:uncharacterized protein